MKSTESVADTRLRRLIQLTLPTIVALRSHPTGRLPVTRWPSEGGGHLAHTPKTVTMPVAADAVARWHRSRPGEVTIDKVSKLIIEQLQQDGRRSYTAIGRAVGLSEAGVRQRVQRLIDGGVIQIVAVTDPMTLGFHRQT